MSALALMAAGENRWLKLGPDDTVILSSHPIPGNEMNVSKVIDGLVRLGVEVVHSGIADVHATGHAKQEELKTLLVDRRARVVHPGARRVPPPRRTTPGWPRRWASHADHVLVCEDGDQLVLDRRRACARSSRVPAGYLYVDGIVGDVGHGVLRDRRVLAEEGVVVVIVTVDVADRRDHHRARDHHPGLGPRPRGRGPARRVPPRGRRQAVDGGVRRPSGPRHRDAPAPRPPGRRPVRQRAHQAPPDDRPRRHGGLSRRQPVGGVAGGAPDRDHVAGRDAGGAGGTVAWPL